MRKTNIELLDDKCILALIMGAIQADTICAGAFLDFLNDGKIIKWLKILKNIDKVNSTPTFIINEIHTIVGAQSIESFKKLLNK